MPFPLFDGGAQSIYHTALGLLTQNVNLKMLAVNTPKNWVDEQTIPVDFREKTKFEYAEVDTRLKPIKAFLNLFSDRSYFVERFFCRGFNSRLIQILQDGGFDVIQLEHTYLCLYINTIRQYSKAKVILRPQNVENRIWNRLLEDKMNPLKKKYLQIASNRLFEFEKKAAQEVDGIIAISPEDSRLFGSYAANVPIVDIPMGFDFGKINNYNVQNQYHNFPVFYHLGSMDWLPNVQGMKWFIQEVIPYVVKQFPEFKMNIAGKKMPGWFFDRQNENLLVEGEIGNSLDYQEDKAIMLVPLLSGGGIRVKIIEGMALGKTIIATSIGAEGIPYTDRENILIANTKEEFAKYIEQCIKSKEFFEQIGNNARLLAMEHFEIGKTARQMINFYKSLIDS